MTTIKRLFGIVTVLLTVGFIGHAAQAGHLYTQGGDGDVPFTISAGQSVDLTLDNNFSGSSSASARIVFNMGFSGDWNAGDTMRLVSSSGSFFDVSFGNAPFSHGGSAFNGTVFSPSFLTAWFNDAVIGQTWQMQALSGSFTSNYVILDIFDGTSLRRLLGSGLDVGPVETIVAANAPGTLAVFALGLAALGGWRRRLRRA